VQAGKPTPAKDGTPYRPPDERQKPDAIARSFSARFVTRVTKRQKTLFLQIIRNKIELFYLKNCFTRVEQKP
jgi:hypothetical protein